MLKIRKNKLYPKWTDKKRVVREYDETGNLVAIGPCDDIEFERDETKSNGYFKLLQSRKMEEEKKLHRSAQKLVSTLMDVKHQLGMDRIDGLVTEYEVMDLKLKMGFLSYLVDNDDLRRTQSQAREQSSETTEDVGEVRSGTTRGS